MRRARVLPGRDRPPGHDPRQDRPCLTGPLPVPDDHLEEPMTHTHEKGGPPTHPFRRDPSDRIRRLPPTPGPATPRRRDRHPPPPLARSRHRIHRRLRPSSKLLRPATAMGTQPNDPVPPSPTPTPGPDTHPRSHPRPRPHPRPRHPPPAPPPAPAPGPGPRPGPLPGPVPAPPQPEPEPDPQPGPAPRPEPHPQSGPLAGPYRHRNPSPEDGLRRRVAQGAY